MITIERETLLAAIKKVIPGVEKGVQLNGISSNNGAEQLLFDGANVHSCNGVVSVTAPCDTQGQEFSVKGQEFFKLVSRMNGDQVSFEIANNKIKVKNGRTRATLPLLDPSKIKAYVATVGNSSVEFKPVPDKFMTALLVSCIPSNIVTIRGVATVEYQDASAVISSDSKRISFTKLSEPVERFLLDDSVIQDALKCGDPDGYSVVGPWFHLHYPDGTIFSAQRKDHSVYPFTKIIESVDRALSTAPLLTGKLPADIKEAVARVAVLASGRDGNNAALIEMTFTNDALVLHAEKDGSEATEEIPWDTKPSNDPNNVSVWVNVEFLEDAVNKSVDFSLVPGARSDSLVFKAGDYIHMVSLHVPKANR